MLKATKPFKDSITNYSNEPSLRIGKTVPEDSVNLAYYYNPVATDAEKIIAAEAPRSTVDHRVEEAYRYLTGMSSDDDNQFPNSVVYEDEEGYSGRLGRMYVQWFPQAHIQTKNISTTKVIRVTNKDEVPKMFGYDDAQDFHGYYYLDAVSWAVCKWATQVENTIVDREILDFELSYKEIFGKYCEPNLLNDFAEFPGTNDTEWPRYIDVALNSMTPSGGNVRITNYIKNIGKNNLFDNAVGRLEFDSISYEQVYKTDSSDGVLDASSTTISNTFNTPWKDIKSLPNLKWPADIDLLSDDEAKSLNDNIQKELKKELENQILTLIFKQTYEAQYNTYTDDYDYTEIEDFLTMAKSPLYENHNAIAITVIEEAMRNNADIAIYQTACVTELRDSSQLDTQYRFRSQYKYRVSTRAEEGDSQYNVVANYKAVKPNALKKTISEEKEVPVQYEGTCHYVGIARKVWNTYDGMAYYRGAVTKGGSMGNINPNDNDELLMFPDANGYLRRKVKVTKEDGTVEDKNFYRVEGDYIYLTDVFKDGVACFYKYPLKRNIYDFRGPNKNGFYEGDSVKVSNASYKDIPKDYKYNIKLTPTEYEIIDIITGDYHLASKKIPKRYQADLYTSFISGATDTFKATYNAFSDVDHDNILIDSGATEEIYNYPFMKKGVDYILEKVDIQTRCNKIKLLNDISIKDTRHWISFSFFIEARRKAVLDTDGTEIVPEQLFRSDIITASILNKDYALKSELSNFKDRGYIVSPMYEDYYASPMDICLKHQSGRKGEIPIVHYDDTDLVFSIEIYQIESPLIGAINITCNADGSGIITAETTVDTGFYNEETGYYNLKLPVDGPYLLENGVIYPGIKVKFVDSRFIKVDAPREEKLLDSWYPLIKFGHYSQIMDQYGTHVKVAYTMPEYDEQHYSTLYHQPYVDIVEEPVTILNSHMVKTKCYPLFVTDNISSTIKLYKKVDDELFDIDIRDVSFSDGIIVTIDTISENDNIVATYTYVEEYYVYRGYWRNKNDFVRLDLNPNIYHTYNDMGYMPSEVKPSKNLFNKVIYFFMKPTVIYDVSADNDSLMYNLEDDSDIGEIRVSNADSLYHQIDNAEPQSSHDIYIGSVYIRQNTSLHSTILIDSRTRGGGISTEITEELRKSLEAESDFYLDIGYFDGEPYQENGVIIIRLDRKILKEFGGRFTQGDIEQKVKRWLGLGIYPIIEYVNTYEKQDMPQYTLEIEDGYTNVEDITPEFSLECISK